MINTLLVDQEMNCLDHLRLLLQEYCPEINVVAQCQHAQAAFEIINSHKPSLIILDADMPGINDLPITTPLKPYSFGVILTSTAHLNARQAAHKRAIAYLKKPITPQDLMASIKKYNEIDFSSIADPMIMMMNYLKKTENNFKKIAFPTSDGFELVPIDKILKCEANDNYTHIYLSDKSIIIACRSLKEIEEQLFNFSNFFRIHHSYIINLNEVTKYVRGEGGYVVLSNGSSVNVSRSRKEALIKFLMHSGFFDL